MVCSGVILVLGVRAGKLWAICYVGLDALYNSKSAAIDTEFACVLTSISTNGDEDMLHANDGPFAMCFAFYLENMEVALDCWIANRRIGFG